MTGGQINKLVLIVVLCFLRFVLTLGSHYHKTVGVFQGLFPTLSGRERLRPPGIPQRRFVSRVRAAEKNTRIDAINTTWVKKRNLLTCDLLS